jgi:hypothetical protein
MTKILGYITLLLSTASAAAIIAAPSATAAREPVRVQLGGATLCQKPGNVAINNTVTPIQLGGPTCALRPVLLARY